MENIPIFRKSAIYLGATIELGLCMQRVDDQTPPFTSTPTWLYFFYAAFACIFCVPMLDSIAMYLYKLTQGTTE